MADTFDPYREALVVETKTLWPESIGGIDERRKEQVAKLLHADPAQCSELQYVRLPTGFCRQITVTEADVERTMGGQTAGAQTASQE